VTSNPPTPTLLLAVFSIKFMSMCVVGIQLQWYRVWHHIVIILWGNCFQFIATHSFLECIIFISWNLFCLWFCIQFEVVPAEVQNRGFTVFGHQRHAVSNVLNCLQNEQFHHLAEKGCRLSHNWTGVQKLGVSMCNIPQWIYGLRKNNGPIILVALRSHHTPVLILCSDTLCISKGSQLFWDFTCQLRWNKGLPLKNVSVGSISPACTPWRYQLIKFSFASWSV
jgi:hypothetical protein